MKALIVYYQVNKTDRNTIYEHLYSFSRYSDYKVTYLNVFEGVPPYIEYLHFDIVVFHYTFLSQKLNGRSFFRSFLAKSKRLKKINAIKVAMPQDEYVNSDLLCDFFSDFGIDVLFTCFESHEWEKVYPKEITKVKHYNTTLTGYVDDIAAEKVKQFTMPHSERPIDIGYRARKLPFWLGEHGTIKWKITNVFENATRNTELVCDLSNNEKKAFLGDDWYVFLSNCRVVLGCEGGASLLDVDGKIRQAVELFVKQHPNSDFDEVKRNCFQDFDNNIELFAISPRHFDASITRTTQVLVEGKYFGIFKPGVHYIEIKKDWSNISEVLDKVRDKSYCESIAENAYRDIILSKKYTYSAFVKNFKSVVDPLVVEKTQQIGAKMYLGRVAFYMYPYLFKFFGKLAYRLRVVGFKLLKIFGLVPLYRRVRSKYLGWEL